MCCISIIVISIIFLQTWKMQTMKVGCNHIQMSQWWQKTPPQMGPLWTFWLFHKKDFLKDIFCNMFLEKNIITPINYMIYVNFF
jgi:hypothetical protein